MTDLSQQEMKMVRDVCAVLDSISGTRKPFNHHHYYLQSRTAETLQDNLRDGGADRNALPTD